MIPQIGKYIEVIFKNNIILKGTLEKWDNFIILSNDESSFIIYNVNDIMAVKIHNKIKESIPVSKIYSNLDSNLKPESYIPDPALRAKSLANLRLEIKKEETERTRRALTTFEPSSGGMFDMDTNKRYETGSIIWKRPKNIKSPLV